MDGFSASELMTRAIKYFLEGLAVAVAMVIIPRKVPNVEEIVVVATVAAVVFAILACNIIVSLPRAELRGAAHDYCNYL